MSRQTNTNPQYLFISVFGKIQDFANEETSIFTNCFRFPKLKIHLKSQTEDIKKKKKKKKKKMVQIPTISKEEFQKCFDQCKTHWNKYDNRDFLKKTTLLFSVHLWLGKYSFSLDNFWTSMRYIYYTHSLIYTHTAIQNSRQWFPTCVLWHTAWHIKEKSPSEQHKIND